MSAHYYKEEQRFNQWWLWLILTLALGVNLFFFIQQLFWGDNTAQKKGVLLFAILVTLGVFIFFYLIRLRTEIDMRGIQFRFSPFAPKEIRWEEIASASVINYGFVGGWGIRYFTRYGTVYNIRGNKGLALQLRNGKKLVIGTQREPELRRFMEALQPLLRDVKVI